MLLRVYLVGVLSLVGVILLDVLSEMLSGMLNFTTWYAFAGNVTSEGLSMAFQNLNVLSYIWLFLVYPLLFGIIVSCVKKKFPCSA